MTHPSFFALDAHLLDPRPGDVQSHLASCAQCQTHVSALQAATPFPSSVFPERVGGNKAPQPVIPSDVEGREPKLAQSDPSTGLGANGRRLDPYFDQPREGSRGAPAWWRFVALGFATAAVLFSLVWFSTREAPPLYTAKGMPTAALWLNRDGKVIIWNGQPIHAGDSVRIEVAPAGFSHVTVFDENTRAVLYEARIPEGTPTLTPAWQFDGQAPSESLRVVLSRAPVNFEPRCVSSAESHCARFVLTRGSPE